MIDHYRGLIDDPLRLGAFERAIAAVVRPGDVVVDVGCGFGTYAIFACRAGAGRVYAVEDSAVIEVAQDVIRENGYADRIHLIPGRSTEVDVPEKARVAIFEDYATCLLLPTTIRVVRDIVSRWLSADGVLVPPRARLFTAPVEDQKGHVALDRFASTRDRVAGISFEATRRRLFSTVQGRRLGASSLMGAASLVEDYDLRALSSPGFHLKASVPASRDGAIHGLLLWFDLELAGAWLGTGPESPWAAWQQSLFPIDPPITAAAGEDVAFSLQAAPFGEDLVWCWTLECGGSRRTADSLSGTPLRHDRLKEAHDGHVPVRSVDLDIEGAILAAVDGRRAVAEIAEGLTRTFPQRFRSRAEAALRVAASLARHRAGDAPSRE